MPFLSLEQKRVHTIVFLYFQQLEATIRPDTSLVSIMTVNNEIGVRQPVHDIGENQWHFSFDQLIQSELYLFLCPHFIPYRCFM